MIEQLTPKIVKELEAEYSDFLSFTSSPDSAITFNSNFRNLPTADRIILMVYAETASERETARLLNVSRTTIRKVLAKIKNEMKQNVNRNE